MKVILSESQLNFLMEGSRAPSLLESVRKMASFTNKLIKKVDTKYKINLKLLATWGPAVGGLVLPLDNFIKNGSFELTDTQSALVLAGVASTIFLEGKDEALQVFKKIKEDGLLDVFKSVFEKGKSLKSTFARFIKSLGTTVESLGDILSYSFLIPIITDIQSLSTRSADPMKSVELIVTRLLASGLVLVAVESLKSLIEKIVKRIS